MKKLLCIFLILTILCSAAGCSGEENSTVPAPVQSHINSKSDTPGGLSLAFSWDYYNSADSIFQGVAAQNLPTDSYDYTNSALRVSQPEYDRFVQYVNNIDTAYSYEAYYQLCDALALYDEALPQQLVHSNSLDTITVDALRERVKSNNAAYKAHEDRKYTSEFFGDFSDQALEEYCRIIVSFVNFYMEAGLLEDEDEVKCILGDLKIFSRPTMTNAYVTDDNCLMISPSMIESMKIKAISTQQDVVASIIGHETMHLLQKGCEHRSEMIYCIGNAYKFEELDVNPLFYNWLYEGSAERLMMNATGYTPLVYESYINYINSLNLSVALNSDTRVSQVEESTMCKTLDSIYRLFGCTSDTQKQEALKMLFSIDIIQTDDEGFVKAVNPNMTNAELIAIKRDLKNSICMTMSKYFYQSLASFVLEQEIPLNDIFYYITVFENDVNSHISFTDPEKLAQAAEFVENYTELQDQFFAMLASSQKYSQQEISELFNSYGLITAAGSKNFNLNSLPEEKQMLFAYVLNFTFSLDFKNIRSLG